MPLNLPSIDYTSRDWASLRQSMLDDAANRLPEWTSRTSNDFGVVMIEEFAALGDMLSYYTDRLADEAYLSTARNRSSILNISETLNYRPDNGQPSRVDITVGVLPGSGRVRVPAGSQFSSAAVDGDLTSLIIFETDTDLYIDQLASDVAYGAVSATQGQTVADEVLGLSVGTPSQVFHILQSPVLEESIIVSVDEGAGPMHWVFYEHLIDASPTTLAYTTRTDAFGRTAVYFGDDVNGRVPFNGAAITVTYRVGGGVSGNVGAGTITNVVSAGDTVSSVSNLASATGGTNPETNDQIRVNAPRALSTLRRAVSLADYGNICFNVVGVAKASAFGLTPNSVTVYIAPSGGGLPSQPLKQRVLVYLGDKKVGPSAQVVVTDPTYVPVNISVDVMVRPQYAQSPVLNAVKNALIDMLAFENVDFKMTLSVSDVYSTLMDVEGVQYVGLRVLARSSDQAPQTVNSIVFGPNELPTSAGGVITVSPSNGIIPSVTSGGTQPQVPTQPGAPVIDTLTCPVGASYNGAFDLTVHWDAALHASAYQVVLDFFHGTTYRGSFDGPTVAVNSAHVTGGFVTDADSVKVRVVAINGPNKTDGPTTTVAYTCGTNTMTVAPGTPDLPTNLHFTSMTLGSHDAFGNLGIIYALAWTNGGSPPVSPATYTAQIQFLDSHGTVLSAGQSLGPSLATPATLSSSSGEQAPAGAVTMQVRLGVKDATGAVVKWTAWAGASVQPYVAPPAPAWVWVGLPDTPVASFNSYARNSDGTVSFTIHTVANNWLDIRYDWWWQDANGFVLHSTYPDLDRGFFGGGGSPGVHYDGNTTAGSNAPAPVTGHAPVVFVVRLTPVNPNGSGPSTTIQHSY